MAAAEEEKPLEIMNAVKNWRSIGQLAKKVGVTDVFERTEKRINAMMAHRHPSTDSLLTTAVDALRRQPSAWDGNTNTAIGLNAMCGQIHEEFTEKICLAEYAEVGVLLHDEQKNAPFCRFHALHGSGVMPNALKVHGGEKIVYDPPIDFVLTRGGLYKGMYGAMMQSLDTLVANDCENDERHIKMPKQHAAMRNLLGLPLWAETGASPGAWHEKGEEKIQDFPTGDAEKELTGLYFIANTSMPGGYSEEFVKSLGVLQWAFGLMMYIVRTMEGQEMKAWNEWEEPEKVDPADGKTLTWDKLVAKYKGTYTEEELGEYWENEMTEPKKKKKKSKL